MQGDIEGLRFNTAIAKMMEFTNHCIRKGKVRLDSAEKFIKCLSPFAPHLAEELWEFYGHHTTLAYEFFPDYDEQYFVEDTFEYPVSFNGKLRFKIALPVSMPDDEIEAAVLGHESAGKWIEGKQVRKVIIVQGKIVNIVVN